MLQRISFPTMLIVWITMLALCMFAFLTASVANAQTTYKPLPTGVRPLLSDNMPPGYIGSLLGRIRPELRGVWQAAEVHVPKGIRVSFADTNSFSPDLPVPARVSLMVGAAYRLRLTSIANEQELELYPTLEIIDRTYPPPEREHRFPIPIEIDDRDIEDAARGELVMRVIYLEDSEIAEPVATGGKAQRVLDVRPTQDALETADQLGRPVAILRIGSRVPNFNDPHEWESFVYGAPQWSTLKEIPVKERLIEQGKWPKTANGGSISDRR